MTSADGDAEPTTAVVVADPKSSPVDALITKEVPAAAAEEGKEQEEQERPAKRRKKKCSKDTVFTIGHPESWELSDLFKAISKHKVKAVVDARPNPEVGPGAEAVRVACSSDSIAYDREPVLSSGYQKLVRYGRHEADEGGMPCVLLSGGMGWRLQQARRCVTQYLKTKGLQVQHLAWNGDIDHEANAECGKELEREPVPHADPQKPVPRPAAPRPALSRAQSVDGLLGGGDAEGAGLLKSKPKAAAVRAGVPTSATLSSADGEAMLKSKPKAAAGPLLGRVLSQEDSTPKGETSFLKARAKSAAANPLQGMDEDVLILEADEPKERKADGPVLEPKPKGGMGPAPPATAPPSVAAAAKPKPSAAKKLWGGLA